MSRAARTSVVVLVGWLLLAAAPPAAAKSYELTEADVQVRVNPDATVDIVELITFRFSGSFSGAYRDIPSRLGEQVDLTTVSVGEEGRRYSPGGTTTLGAPGPANTFAVGSHDGGTRVVWRYEASDETRTFRVSYRMTGLVRLHADTAELNLRVWGDHWPVGLRRLRASVVLPSRVSPQEIDRFRVWGNSQSVWGVTDRSPDGSGATLEAAGIPSEEWVEIRMLFPPSVLQDTRGATVMGSPGFDRIVAEEMAEEEAAMRAAERRAWVIRNLWWLLPALGLVLFAPASLYMLWIGRRYGTDPQVLPLPAHYTREPPTDDPPALVGALLKEGGKVGTDEFLATFFDLIRRGFFSVERELSDRKTWLGMKTETISDLRVKLTGEPVADLPPHERDVYDALEWVIPPNGELLSRLSDQLKERATSFYNRYTSFQEHVAAQLEQRGWVERRGRRLWGAGIAIFVGVLALGIAVSVVEANVYRAPFVGVPLILAGFTNAFVLGLVGGLMPRALTRRSPEGARIAAGYEGLRRYLEDFSAMRDAPPVSLVLWERLLVSGIVLGVADNVLRAAQLVAPQDLQDRSQLFWVDGSGTGLGDGLTALNLSSLTSGFGRVVSAGAPTSSGSGGGAW